MTWKSQTPGPKTNIALLAVRKQGCVLSAKSRFVLSQGKLKLKRKSVYSGRNKATELQLPP